MTDTMHAEVERPPNLLHSDKEPMRFLKAHIQLHSLYGDDWFSLKAEAFARFFGTPIFITAQTAIVTLWITINSVGFAKFDLYPFILLNLAFSLQAAYAAPLILLAQTRQADRDKIHVEADARHREDIARTNEDRQALITRQTTLLLEMLAQNTQLTQSIKVLAEKLETLTTDVHQKMMTP